VRLHSLVAFELDTEMRQKLAAIESRHGLLIDTGTERGAWLHDNTARRPKASDYLAGERLPRAELTCDTKVSPTRTVSSDKLGNDPRNVTYTDELPTHALLNVNGVSPSGCAGEPI